MEQKELEHPLSPFLCCWMHNASAVWDVLIEQMNQSGHQSATIARRSLGNMYHKSGSNLGSLESINGIATYDVVTWNAMIQGYSVKCEEGWKVLKLNKWNMAVVQVVPVKFFLWCSSLNDYYNEESGSTKMLWTAG